MEIARVGHVRAYSMDGAVEHILLRPGKFEARNLLVTWSTVAPRGQLRGHTHAGSEHVYIIVAGTARMQVGDERQVLSPATLVYVPPGTPHSIANAGSDDLVFISVASPPYPVERLYAAPRAQEPMTAEPEIPEV